MGRIAMPKVTITRRTKAEENEEGMQSCRYCPMGTGGYKVESDEGTYYVCEKHKVEYKL